MDYEQFLDALRRRTGLDTDQVYTVSMPVFRGAGRTGQPGESWTGY